MALPLQCALFLTALSLAFAGGCRFDFDEKKLEGGCSAEAEGAACDGGTCHAGACCTGCWDGTTCSTGDSPSACGATGASCQTCANPTAACEQGACVAERAVISIAAGATHTCAADRLRTLWCWGGNDKGQAARPVTELNIPTPRAVSSGEWIEVAAGGAVSGHSCAIHFAGSLWCWGDNAEGQLGTGGGSVEPAPTLIDDNSWRHVALGDLHSCAIQQGDTLHCWGLGDDGRLGFAGSSPVPTMVGVDADWDVLDLGARHGAAIKQDGTLWSWGDNAKGQLGRSGGQAERPGLVGNGYVSVSAGAEHTCAIRSDRSLWCWGDDSGGQLGFSGSVGVPTQVGSDTNWSVVAAGRAHTCALKDDGSLHCWGDNSKGQVGVSPRSATPQPPTRLEQRSDWKHVVSGADHVCASTRAGLLFCWGASGSFQTGLGVNQDQTVPTAVTLAVGN